MSDKEYANRNLARFNEVKRTSLKLSKETLVKQRPLFAGSGLPLLIEPVSEDVGLVSWVKNNSNLVAAELAKHGAILFRGFNCDSAATLEQLIRAVSGAPLEYTERSSPRSQVSGNVYTSTDYPADKSIFPHNEQSYNLNFILKIFFCCLQRAEHGGETPIIDCRNVFNRIDPKIRERFIEKKYMYVRNFRQNFGLSWQTAFQTTDRAAVEAYCSTNEIGFEWMEDNRLRTWQVRQPVARHPRTGELVWFNHLTFFHVSTLEPAVRDWMLSQFEEKDLPNNTYYGDGSPIESSVLDELRGAYLSEKVVFPWQEGDVLMLDNMLTAHAREPFAGARKVIVGMAEPFSWKNISSKVEGKMLFDE
jgi:alpha-ketoglutarate-dependent taurine dioxygenase